MNSLIIALNCSPALVELLLSEVVVLVHGLHQGTEHVNGGVRDAVIIPLESLGHLPAHLLPEASQSGEAPVSRLARHKASESMELLL